MIIPSIDLMNGKAVQLINGKKKVLEVENVRELMEKFSRFSETAIIDLDRVFGNGDNLKLIKELCKLGDCRVGGGLRTVDDIEEILNAGAKKVIISSSVFNELGIDFDFLNKLNKKVKKERIIIAADNYKGKITISGWRKEINLTVNELIKKTKGYCGGYLVTTVEREGEMKGLDLELAKELRVFKETEITLAGGLSTLTELNTIGNMGFDVQVGMSLYKGKVTIEEGFIESLNFKEGLIPVITKDEFGQILMLAYASKESLSETFKTGYMTYFSRSRNKLWKKGEESGNLQTWLSAKVDCDKDTLIMTVKQKGVACHKNKYSCFEDKNFSLKELESVVVERMENPKEKSYTSSLSETDIKAKLIEEVNELVNAYSRENLIWEAADVFYFVLTFLAKNKIRLSEVMDELRRRREK